MTKTIITIFILVGLLFFIWLLSNPEAEPTPDQSTESLDSTTVSDVELQAEQTVLRLRSASGDELQDISIDQFNQWAADNWADVFTEPPAFGDVRAVDAEFDRFDQATAVLAEDEAVLFVVSDYAVATTLSFLGRYTIATEAFDLFAYPNNGGISQLSVSPTETYVAYTLDTARAQGDALVVAEIAGADRLLEIDAERILDALWADSNLAVADYLPMVREVHWQNNTTLSFVVADQAGEDREVRFDVAADDFLLP